MTVKSNRFYRERDTRLCVTACHKLRDNITDAKNLSILCPRKRLVKQISLEALLLTISPPAGNKCIQTNVS